LVQSKFLADEAIYFSLRAVPEYAAGYYLMVFHTGNSNQDPLIGPTKFDFFDR